jgi:uncharacterized protein YfdQ (DUF2303 family)
VGSNDNTAVVVDTTVGTAAVVEKLVTERSKVEILTVTDSKGLVANLASVPSGRELVSLKEHFDRVAPRPDRREGTALFTKLDSFVQHTVRFKDAHSTIWADANPNNPSLTAVLDYHEAGATGLPRFGKHRGKYTFPLAPEWQAWAAASGKQMGQKAFAEFIENRLADIAAPEQAGEIAKGLAAQLGLTFASPSKLVNLAKGLTVREAATVRNHTNLSTGEVQIQYETAHTGADNQPLTVPGAFCISVPVFKGGAVYVVPVRLRYRLAAGKDEQRTIQWFVEVYRADLYFDDAFNDACRKVAADVGADGVPVPVLYGVPE